MGCWNGSCAISGLPILYGEKVWAIFLGTNPISDGSFCHSDEEWCPQGFWFQGQYNDYGALTDTCHMAIMNLELIRERLIEYKVPEEEKTSRNFDITKENLDIDLLFKAEWANRLKINTKFAHVDDSTSRLKLIMVKDVIMKDILKNYDPSFYNYVEKRDQSLSGLIYSEFGRIAMEYAKEQDSPEPPSLINLIWYDSSLRAYTSPISQTLNVNEIYVRGFREGGDLRNDMFHQIKKHVTFNSFMNQSRRSWIPPSGAGSQSEEMEAHKTFAKVLERGIEHTERQLDYDE